MVPLKLLLLLRFFFVVFFLLLLLLLSLPLIKNLWKTEGTLINLELLIVVVAVGDAVFVAVVLCWWYLWWSFQSLQHGNGAAGDTHTKRQCLSSVTLLLTCTASPSATKNISSRLYDRIGFTGSDFSARERGQRFERFATELSAWY